LLVLAHACREHFIYYCDGNAHEGLKSCFLLIDGTLVIIVMAMPMKGLLNCFLGHEKICSSVILQGLDVAATKS